MRRTYQIVSKNGRGKLSGKQKKAMSKFFRDNGQMLLPMVDLIESSQAMLSEVYHQAGRIVIETILSLSAESIAGPKHPGKANGEVVWYGSQPGTVRLSNQQVKVDKPRVRKKSGGPGAEVAVPAYAALQDNAALSERVGEILMQGVSTRNYRGVIEETADTVGVSRSSVSRNFIESGERALASLLERRFDRVDILVIYIDGQRFGNYHVITALGVDVKGNKHVLGIYAGATENSTVVKYLLRDLVDRGLDPGCKRLFVIDGSKALRCAIDAIFGSQNPVQRCRNHKVQNVMDHLPDELKEQVKSVMKAAYRLEWKEGIKKLEQQAKWLESEYPSAAGSLREGLEETFTVNRLELPRTLRRCLCTTNIIESPQSGVRMRTRRVTRWRDQHMVLYWSATAWLETEKHFKRIQGYRELWVLKSALDDDFAKDRFAERREVG